MGDVVNLRRARKERARIEHEKTAEENRLRFGRTKAQREHDRLEREIAERSLDGHVVSSAEDRDD